MIDKDHPPLHQLERISRVKNRMRESRSSGSVGGEGGNLLAYPAPIGDIRSIVELHGVRATTIWPRGLFDHLVGADQIDRKAKRLGGLVETIAKMDAPENMYKWRPAGQRRIGSRTSTSAGASISNRRPISGYR